MNDETCEGFANYPTFAVAVGIDNDREQLDYWNEQATEALSEVEARTARSVDAAGHLAVVMREYFDQKAPEVESPFAEFVSYGLSSVDWRELGEHYLENVE